MSIEPGARLGRYEIVGLLGAGGMGIVFEARDVELDRIVALKLVRPRSEDLEAARTSLRREAHVMARLSHANVTAVFDLGLVDEHLFIAMEIVRGGTLRERIGPHHPWRDQLRILRAAGRGLAAAHQAGVVHRDFKPDNVLVGHSRVVRVSDFGLAYVARASSSCDEHTRSVREAAAEIAGTRPYMAPECFGNVANAATDQFAFAVTAFETFEGRYPFHGGLTFDATHGHGVTIGRRLPWRRLDVPLRIRAVIDRGLALEPAARWPSMRELCAALKLTSSVEHVRSTRCAFNLVRSSKS